MYKFYVNELNFEKNIVISGNDVNHIKNVLRLQVGQEITINNGDSKDYICVISEISGSNVVCEIIDIISNNSELSTKIILFQGYPKSDKMEFIIQKAVELGVYEVVPVIMERSIVKIDSKKEKSKIERFNKISEAAAKQSKRNIIPTIKKILNFNEAIEYAKSLEKTIVPYEEAKDINESRKIISALKETKTLGVFIGPEGGFSISEIEKLKSIDSNIITLGNRILRTETAGIAILSIIMFGIE